MKLGSEAAASRCFFRRAFPSSSDGCPVDEAAHPGVSAAGRWRLVAGVLLTRGWWEGPPNQDSF